MVTKAHIDAIYRSPRGAIAAAELAERSMEPKFARIAVLLRAGKYDPNYSSKSKPKSKNGCQKKSQHVRRGKTARTGGPAESARKRGLKQAASRELRLQMQGSASGKMPTKH